MESVTFETILSTMEIEKNITTLIKKKSNILSNSIVMLLGDITMVYSFDGYCVNNNFKLTGYGSNYRKTIEITGSVIDTGILRIVNYNVNFLKLFDWLFLCFVYCLFFGCFITLITSFTLIITIPISIVIFLGLGKIIFGINNRIVKSTSKRVFRTILSGKNA